MTFRHSTAHSGSHDGLVVNPDSLREASPKSNTEQQTEYEHYQEFDSKKKQKVWKKRKFVATFPVQTGRGMSNFNSNWNILNPELQTVVSRDPQTGDRIEFRTRGTKCKYRHTFEPDGSLRKPHKLNFPHFVLIRNYKKNPNKGFWKNQVRKNC